MSHAKNSPLMVLPNLNIFLISPLSTIISRLQTPATHFLAISLFLYLCTVTLHIELYFLFCPLPCMFFQRHPSLLFAKRGSTSPPLYSELNHPSDYYHQTPLWGTTQQKLTTVPFIWAVATVCLPITPEFTWHTFMVGTFKFTLFTKCCKDKNMLPPEKDIIKVKFTLRGKIEKEGEGWCISDLWEKWDFCNKNQHQHWCRRWLLPCSDRGHCNSEGRVSTNARTVIT